MTLPIVPPPLWGGGVNLLYFANASPPFTPNASNGAWDWGFAFRNFERGMKIVPTGAYTSGVQTEANPNDTAKTMLSGIFISSPLLQSVQIFGNLALCLALRDDGVNMGHRMSIYVTQGATMTVRGVLVGTNNFFTGAIGLTAQGYLTTLGMGSVNAQAGDHIVFELGWNFVGESGTQTGTIHYGGTGTTLLGNGDTDVANHPSWARFENTPLPLGS